MGEAKVKAARKQNEVHITAGQSNLAVVILAANNLGLALLGFLVGVRPASKEDLHIDFLVTSVLPLTLRSRRWRGCVWAWAWARHPGASCNGSRGTTGERYSALHGSTNPFSRLGMQEKKEKNLRWHNFEAINHEQVWHVCTGWPRRVEFILVHKPAEFLMKGERT